MCLRGGGGGGEEEEEREEEEEEEEEERVCVEKRKGRNPGRDKDVWGRESEAGAHSQHVREEGCGKEGPDKQDSVKQLE